MKFIYCMNKAVSKDLEDAGLKKLGKAKINGEDIDIFENSKEIYINKYQKAQVLLTNKLFFDFIPEDKKED